MKELQRNIMTARKQTRFGARYFRRVCQEFCSGGGRGGGIPACIAGGIPACIAGGIPACLAGLQGDGIPACLAGLRAHTQGGS